MSSRSPDSLPPGDPENPENCQLRQVATAAVPQYNSDMRRLFLFPRYQRDAARLLDAKEQDEMEAILQTPRSATRAFRAEAACGKLGGHVPAVVNAVACG